MNSIAISGRLTKDPDRFMTKHGKLIAKFTLAVNGRQDKEGNASTMWLDVTTFTYTAEYALKYFHKGDLVGVEGSLEHEYYTNAKGDKRQSFFIIANRLESLRQAKPKDGSDTAPLPGLDDTPQANEQAKDAFGGISDDDMPF